MFVDPKDILTPEDACQALDECEISAEEAQRMKEGLRAGIFVAWWGEDQLLMGRKSDMISLN